VSHGFAASAVPDWAAARTGKAASSAALSGNTAKLRIGAAFAGGRGI
jgi:hypothetical protein